MRDPLTPSPCWWARLGDHAIAGLSGKPRAGVASGESSATRSEAMEEGRAGGPAGEAPAARSAIGGGSCSPLAMVR